MSQSSIPLADRLHPRVATWFASRFGAFTDGQSQAVPHILNRHPVLLSSPTGSGKTLAGFLAVIDHLVRQLEAGTLTDTTHAIYISPLRALTYDIEKNLNAPLSEMGLAGDIRVALRTGDTKASDRAKFRRKPAHILLTTPESLAITLCQLPYQRAFSTCHFVVVDELHALAENKRGSHLAVSLERLELLARQPITRVGLSATVSPLDQVAQFLVGHGPGRHCEIIEAQAGRRSFVEVLSPLGSDPYPASGWTAVRIIADIARIVANRNTTIIFTNTRSGAENISHRLKSALPDIAHLIGTHHSSLDRDLRLDTEDRLKHGELRAVVCSTSLELGIDIGSVDTVIMVSTPKGISRTLQRIGRSGHSVHKDSHGVLCATNINDLVECVVCAQMTKLKKLDPVRLPGPAADVAAQHIVGMAFGTGTTRDHAFTTLTRAHPFHTLSRQDFDRIVDYLIGGGESLRKQYTETFGKISEAPDGTLTTTGRKTERDYLVNVGTIHAEGMVTVYLGGPDTRRKKLGEVEERFLKGIRHGDIFVLAGKTVRLLDTSATEATVTPARGLPTVPSWNANKMPLASGLARQVTAFRTELDRLLDSPDLSRDAIVEGLVEEWSISIKNAAAIVTHFENQRLISQIPIHQRLLIELYREESADPPLLHYCFHTLVGRSANDALSRIISHRLRHHVGGNALVTIDDYGFLLTLREHQALDLEGWRELFQPENAAADLDSALLGSPLVKYQFRGVAQTGLMVPRNLPGKQRQLRQIRWSTEILYEVLSQHEPDHPLFEEARRTAKHTYLDTSTALNLLFELQSHHWKLTEIPSISPFAFGLYASKIRESLMMEDPADAIERLFQDFSRKAPTKNSSHS